MSWQQLTEEEQRRHEEEIAKDLDDEMSKEPLWWHFIEEWLKEKTGDRLR